MPEPIRGRCQCTRCQIATVQRGQAGDWRVINLSPQTPYPLYWMGAAHPDGRLLFSFAYRDAAQFPSEAMAQTAARVAKMIGPWRVECHGWD